MSSFSKMCALIQLSYQTIFQSAEVIGAEIFSNKLIYMM